MKKFSTSQRFLILNKMKNTGKGAVDGRNAFNYLNIDFPKDKTGNYW